MPTLITTFTVQNFFGDIRGVEAPYTTFGDILVATDLGGNFKIGSFDTFIVGGTLSTNLPSGDKLTIESFGAGKTLLVGKTLDHEIEVAGQFDGQVICNADYGSYYWGGSFKYTAGGSLVALATIPHYSNAAAAIGSGAVGLVPYSIRSQDCLPVNASTACLGDYLQNWGTSESQDWRETIVISHYGPVIDSQPGGSIPFIVERQSLSCPFGTPCPGAATDISSSCTVSMNRGANHRDVWVCLSPVSSLAQPFGTGYRYTLTPRITSTHTDLRSDGTGLSTAPDVASYSYYVDSLCD